MCAKYHVLSSNSAVGCCCASMFRTLGKEWRWQRSKKKKTKQTNQCRKKFYCELSSKLLDDLRRRRCGVVILIWWLLGEQMHYYYLKSFQLVHTRTIFPFRLFVFIVCAWVSLMFVCVIAKRRTAARTFREESARDNHFRIYIYILVAAAAAAALNASSVR